MLNISSEVKIYHHMCLFHISELILKTIFEMFEKYLKAFHQLYRYIPVFGKTGGGDKIF